MGVISAISAFQCEYFRAYQSRSAEPRPFAPFRAHFPEKHDLLGFINANAEATTPRKCNLNTLKILNVFNSAAMR